MRKRTKKGNKKKVLITLASILVLLVVFVVIGIDSRLIMQSYTVNTAKVDTAIRLVVVADMHSSKYGDDQTELVDFVAAQNPDVVLVCGDSFDDELAFDNAIKTIKALSSKYDVYGVLGNHEVRRGVSLSKEKLTESGMKVLDGVGEKISINGQELVICGVDDSLVGEKEYLRQLEGAAEYVEEGVYSILLAHRPEDIDKNSKYGFDMVLSGHAHGGQWRIPGLVNGIYSPGQGFLPKYAGGEYTVDETKLIVSRGLALDNTAVPRVYNRPEVVVIELQPEAAS